MIQKPFQLDVDTWKRLKILSLKIKKPMARIIEELVLKRLLEETDEEELKKLMNLI